MDVINLSLGEPEVEPSRDLVVHAIDGAAKAGVVPVIAAGNDFDQFGYGSVSSPANAPDAITVAATTDTGTIADFSSAGPDACLAAAQARRQRAGRLGSPRRCRPTRAGRRASCPARAWRAPHVAGGVVLLKQRHPTWTVAQIKSALVQTGDPVHDRRRPRGLGAARGRRADRPRPRATTPCSSPRRPGSRSRSTAAPRTVSLTDAGGGAGPGRSRSQLQEQHAGVTVTAPPTRHRPGRPRGDRDGRAVGAQRPTSPASWSSRTAATRAGSRSGSAVDHPRARPRAPRFR